MIRRYALDNKEFNVELLEMETKYYKKFSDFYKALNYLIKKDEKEAIPSLLHESFLGICNLHIVTFYNKKKLA